MSTYIYRDARRHNIIDALAALDDEQADLKEILEKEQIALQTDDWTATDETFEAVAADWLWHHFFNFAGLVNKDPVLMAIGAVSTLTPLQIAAVRHASVPHATRFPPHDYLAKILVAVDDDEAKLTEIVQAAHQVWLFGREEIGDYPFDDVGVLLPVRLETLFDEPASKDNGDPDRWKLSIRVIPDEASVCRDNLFVSKDELKALVAFWKLVQQPGVLSEVWLDGDDAKVAWKQLSTRIRPERASWLAASLEVEIDADDLKVVVPADMPEQSQSNRVGGIPPEMNIFAVTTGLIGGESHHSIGRLPMDKDKMIDNELLQLELPSNLNETKKSWWASWEKAKEVGLGGEFFLPLSITPQNIEALYVVGIGEEKPNDHFKKQSIAGELSISKLGVPTNTVHGKNAGDPINWLKVTQSRLANRLNPVAQNNVGSDIQVHLTGQPDAIPIFPGSDLTDDTLLSQHMVRALWPALWGEWLKDIWEMGDKAYHRALWAFENLCPEGPLMPLRLRNQPYGLLPVTSLEQWEVEAGRPADRQKVETEIAGMMNRMRSLMANAIKDKRSVVGKTSLQFMNLLSQPSRSNKYIGRDFLPFGAPISIYKLTPDQQQQFMDQMFKAYDAAISLMDKKPANLYLCTSNGYKLRLPLIQTTNSLLRHKQREFREPMPLIDLITLLVNFPDGVSEVNYDLDEFFPNRGFSPNNDFQIAFLPDSLFIRLLVHACQTGYLWHRADPGNPLLQRVLDVQQKESMNLAADIDKDEWRNKEEDKGTGRLVFNSIIPEDIRKQWERAFTATMDSAAQRIDPWVTGFAWQRLKLHSRSPRHNHRLGVYGWVDGPFNGVPGPTDSGLLHAPSYNQALTALIMRDKFLSSGRSAFVNDKGNNPWQMNITSKKVRLAEELAEEVRIGCHIYEVIGRHVENIVGKKQKVVELRTNPKYAMHSDRKDVNEVCNGNEALAGLLAGDPDFLMLPQQTDALQLLKDSLDTYSDLLMAEGVVQVINRQMDRAAETMDGAAGESRPPNFDFIRTPPSGYQLETLVLSAIPFVSIEDIAEKTHPIRLADASVAVFVENKMGNNWTWTATNEDDDVVLGSADLAALGFAPADILFLSDELMRELVRYKLNLPLVFISEGQNREWNTKDAADNITGAISIKQLGILPEEFAAKEETERFDLIRTILGVAATDTIEELMPGDLHLWIAKDEKGVLLGIADKDSIGAIPDEKELLHKSIRQSLGVPKVLVKSPREHQLAQQLVAALGNRPASGRDLTDDKSAPVVVDTDIYDELKNRYNTLYDACADIIGKLNDAGNDDATRANLLRQALPWGVIPASDPANREALMAALLGLPLPVVTTPLSELTAQVAETLQKRLDSSVDKAKLASADDMKAPLKDHEDLKQKDIPDGVPTLARAIANLASPNAGLAILACWNKPAIENNSGLNTDASEEIHEEWLTVMAAVRAKLAKLEALQLEMNNVFITWTNSLHDPWRTGNLNIVQQNLKNRQTQSASKIAMTRFVAAYGSDTTWAGNKIAVGLIDSFNEAVPMPQRKTMSAFGFNAPAARAPQAILLAVPPKLRQRLDTKVILKILEETRELAKARMARIEDFGELQTLAPTMWLKATGPSRVRLEPVPLYIV